MKLCFITSSDFTLIIDYDYTYKQNRCIKYLNIYVLKNKLKVDVDDDEKKGGNDDLCLLLM